MTQEIKKGIALRMDYNRRRRNRKERVYGIQKAEENQYKT